ncbi:hypothetical protein DFH08DRAFT_73845 [Mycena albidolilacea]|uniref:Uncharacterized protein n=1 Tax=Mycena albidolilacea TaxID=1033008 RepID=A0AAD6YZR3_9AGAR|nr:hypothetical protein DFH08DRAFT_73845 [Mycena albidolilacea]
MVETARCSRTRAHGPTPRKPARINFTLPSMDTTRDWFLSMRKIGPGLDDVVCSPLWSYQFELQTGFMPIDPRDSVGVCGSRRRERRLRQCLQRAADGRHGHGYFLSMNVLKYRQICSPFPCCDTKGSARPPYCIRRFVYHD